MEKKSCWALIRKLSGNDFELVGLCETRKQVLLWMKRVYVPGRYQIMQVTSASSFDIVMMNNVDPVVTPIN